MMMKKISDVERIRRLIKEDDSESNPSNLDILWDVINGIHEEEILIDSPYMDFSEGKFVFYFDGLSEVLSFFFPEEFSEDELSAWDWAYQDTGSYYGEDSRDDEFPNETFYTSNLSRKDREKMKNILGSKIPKVYQWFDQENDISEDNIIELQNFIYTLGIHEEWLEAYDYAVKAGHTEGFDDYVENQIKERISKAGIEPVRGIYTWETPAENLLIMYSIVGDGNENYDTLIQKYLEKKKINSGLAEYPHEDIYSYWNNDAFEHEYSNLMRFFFRKLQDTLEDVDSKDLERFEEVKRVIEKLGGWKEQIYTPVGSYYFEHYDIESGVITYRFIKGKPEDSRSRWWSGATLRKNWEALYKELFNYDLFDQSS